MKLEKLFKSENNKLFKMDGSAVEITAAMLKSVSWNDVEGAEEVYNEQYLSQLRDELKAIEEKGGFVVVAPVYNKKGAIPGQFINAMKHTARRIKDCKSVIGFAIPDEIADDGEVVDFYTATLSEKHEQYVYFSKKPLKEEIVQL